MPTSRLFIAVPIPDKQKQLLARWVKEKKTEWPFAKWVFPDDYHITLQFLGECTTKQIEQIVPALQQVAQRQSPFSLAVTGLGIFGSPTQPRILWAGVRGDLERLHQLQQHVTRVMAPLGFPPDDRPYRPHVTLARKAQLNHFPSGQLDQMQPWETHKSSWVADQMVLYETQTGQKPMYASVAQFDFSG